MTWNKKNKKKHMYHYHANKRARKNVYCNRQNNPVITGNILIIISMEETYFHKNLGQLSINRE